MVAGHVIECGPQATGGNYSWLDEITDRRYPGFPIAEVAADGSAVITKHPGTGGPGVAGHGHRAAAVRDRRARLPATRTWSRTSTRRRWTHEGPDRVRDQRHPRQPAAGPPQGGAQLPRRLPQHDDAGADRPGHRGEGGLGGERAVRPPGRQATSSARSTSGCSASTGPTRRPTSRPPRTCGSRSRTRTRRKVGRRFSNAVMELALGGYAGFHTTTPPTPESAYGVYWPALVPGRRGRARGGAARRHRRTIPPPTARADAAPRRDPAPAGPAVRAPASRASGGAAPGRTVRAPARPGLRGPVRRQGRQRQRRPVDPRPGRVRLAARLPDRGRLRSSCRRRPPAGAPLRAGQPAAR